MEVLQDKEKIGLHVALTPTWSETAWFADYILPMGLGTERHDTMSQETHAGQWLGFRQPVLRVAREKRGEKINATYEANPGEVWEESGVLDRAQLEDRSRRLARHPQVLRVPVSSRRADHRRRVLPAGCSRTRCPGLPEAAAKENLTPLEYMRKYGVFKVSDKTYSRGFERTRSRARRRATTQAARGVRRTCGRRRPTGLQHAVAHARVLLADDGGVGLAGARGAALRAGARALARSRSATRASSTCCRTSGCRR